MPEMELPFRLRYVSCDMLPSCEGIVPDSPWFFRFTSVPLKVPSHRDVPYGVVHSGRASRSNRSMTRCCRRPCPRPRSDPPEEGARAGRGAPRKSKPPPAA